MSANGNNGWPRVRLGDVLELRAADVSVKPSESYQFAGVYSFGRGVFRGQQKQGDQFAYPRLTRLRTGDFVYPKLMAWEGAFGVVPTECDACYVSPEFPVFTVDTGRVMPRFLNLYFRRASVWEAFIGGSKGTNARRRRLHPNTFLAREFPLPPLAEQKRIADRHDAVAARAARVREALKEGDDDSEALLTALAHRTDLDAAKKLDLGWQQVPLENVLGRHEDAHAVCLEKSYPNLGIYCFGKGIFSKPPIDGAATAAPVLYRVRAGQFIYSRLFAFERSYGLVPAEMEGWFVSGEFPAFDINADRVLPEFLYAYFRPQHVWNRLMEGSRGLGSRRVRIHPEQILAHRAFIPPMSEQIRIRETKLRLDTLRARHDAHRADLDALLPSLLDRAFTGRL